MGIYKLATAVQCDSTLNRDRMMINPVIQDVLGGDDVQQLAQDWAAAMASQLATVGTPFIEVKVYDLEKTRLPGGPPVPPNPPVARATANAPTSFLTASYPREIALCLSFYSEFNIKRQRGRLYIPLSWIQNAGEPGNRPTATHRNAVKSFADRLQSLGGVDDDWSIWSNKDRVARKVTNWFVDDEWDTQRRRGLRSTTRLTGVTSE